jgi:hypothetical protein
MSAMGRKQTLEDRSSTVEASMSSRDHLQAAFGVPEFPDGLFYQYPCALRFSLGGEDWGRDRPVIRFLQAIGRCRDSQKPIRVFH